MNSGLLTPVAESSVVFIGKEKFLNKGKPRTILTSEKKNELKKFFKRPYAFRLPEPKAD